MSKNPSAYNVMVNKMGKIGNRKLLVCIVSILAYVSVVLLVTKYSPVEVASGIALITAPFYGGNIWTNLKGNNNAK